jgi:hypothetical protein
MPSYDLAHRACRADRYAQNDKIAVRNRRADILGDAVAEAQLPSAPAHCRGRIRRDNVTPQASRASDPRDRRTNQPKPNDRDTLELRRTEPVKNHVSQGACPRPLASQNP